MWIEPFQNIITTYYFNDQMPFFVKAVQLALGKTEHTNEEFVGEKWLDANIFLNKVKLV